MGNPELRKYITTPIYYVNDVPHIGHAYTTIACDVLARFYRMIGSKVFFLTGTDEHGQKIEQAAIDKNETPLQLANRVVLRFQNLWKELNISHDYFIRTTHPQHKQFVQECFLKVLDKGDIYLGEYEDWYCTPCETFLTENQLVNGRCPQCGREVKKLKEPSYFFKLSKYEKPLLDFLEKNPHFIEPESRFNEIKSFVASGLKDLSLSRTSFSWGIPVPKDAKHVIYVWFDALLNYYSALNIFSEEHPESKALSFWPANVHVVGKDILRFHTVYWPAFLMSLGLELPKKVFAHGWWTHDGKKMSKSLGNVIDPSSMAQTYGVDCFRYFLLREVPFGLDGDFAVGTLEKRINADLANDLGNLLSRVTSMYHKYFGETVLANPRQNLSDLEKPFYAINDSKLKKNSQADQTPISFTPLQEAYGKLQFHSILQGIWQWVRLSNNYIDLKKPWELAKEASKKDELLFALNHLIEALRLIALSLHPFMPQKTQMIWETLGFSETEISHLSEITSFEKQYVFGLFPHGMKLKKPQPLFPRIEMKK